PGLAPQPGRTYLRTAARTSRSEPARPQPRRGHPAAGRSPDALAGGKQAGPHHRAQSSISGLSGHTPARLPSQVSRSGKANIEDEVSEPQIQGSAAGPVDDECEQ